MRAYTLDHVSDTVLLRGLTLLVARDRTTTASLLAHLAEVDERKLYLPAGYASMFAYCVGELHFSEDAAAKRIQAARAARKFPALLDAVAEGRLHLTGVRLLAPHLTAGNLDEMLAASLHQGKAAIEMMLVRRAATPDSGLDLGSSSVAVSAASESGTAPLPPPMTPHFAEGPRYGSEHAPGHVHLGHAALQAPAAAPVRIPLKFSVSEATHLKLQHARELLSHAVPSGDLEDVLDRALDALIEKLEKRKFAATSRPQAARTDSARPRHVPAHVRRAVWERDEGRCTFVGNTGHRCGQRRFLEFDHAEPVARGGLPTIEGIRLRCRAHNQYEAERIFGEKFMKRKRSDAKQQPQEDGPAPGGAGISRRGSDLAPSARGSG